ncbi:hypothetical protein F2Q68_00026762 [Brassica cretica]|uniref:Uncharacterized protein n=1 Tax=Brassica cretica TaxID=69181 RepID=A0A8S9I6D9_BRACR|nr:hypothetical protein F2Q68_00026762 [Brassica cretica]
MDSPTTGVPPGHSGNSVCDGLASPLDTPSTYGRTHHSCSMLLPCTLPYGIVHTFRMGALPGQVRSGHGIPRPFGSPILGGLVLSPFLLKSCFLFRGFLDQFMDITVVSHVAAVVWGCSPPLLQLHHWVVVPHSPASAFCLAGGLSRRPSGPSCCSLGGRSCPCNSGVLGRHPFDKRRSVSHGSTHVLLPTESGSVAAPPRVPFLVQRHSQSVHGHHGGMGMSPAPAAASPLGSCPP